MIENYTSTTTNDITNSTGYTTISLTDNSISSQKKIKKYLGDDIIMAAHIIKDSIQNCCFIICVTCFISYIIFIITK